MDEFLVDLSNKAGELCYQTYLEKLKIFETQCESQIEHENQVAAFTDF